MPHFKWWIAGASELERAVTFGCAGQRLIGVVSEASGTPSLGVLVLVGGPQYRVGSHRQFLLLARRLAEAGFPTMRFDYRGMGDSTGSAVTFDDTVPDIEAAILAFKAACPSVERVVLWGLCDAASAALLYWKVTRDPRVAGMVLLNPWIRSEQSIAATHVKHYYLQRFIDRTFWVKLATGEVKITVALRELIGKILVMFRPGPADERAATSFQDRMAAALADFTRPVLLILSGRDYTAKEFLEYASSDRRWKGLIARDTVARADLTKADHTFSTAAWRQEVEALTLDWLIRSCRSAAT